MTTPSPHADYPSTTPEATLDLMTRVAKLEEVVRTLIGHQHQHRNDGRANYGMVNTTRPIGMSGTKV